jgi:hypothetical protein
MLLLDPTVMILDSTCPKYIENWLQIGSSIILDSKKLPLLIHSPELILKVIESQQLLSAY